MVRVETTAYCKIALHAVKYPHCTVRGVVLGKVQNNDVIVTDAVPILHAAFLAPPVEAALINIAQFCNDSSLKIVGSYATSERLNDNNLDFLWTKVIHDKLVANGIPHPVAFRVEDSKLSLNSNSSCLVSYTCDSGKWKQSPSTLSNNEEALATYTAALQSKLHRELSDFESHLDDPAAEDFFNVQLGQKIAALAAN